MVNQILRIPERTKLLLLAPLIENRKGEHREQLAKLVSDGFSRVRIDGSIYHLDKFPKLDKRKKHSIEIVVDRLVIAPGKEFQKRVTDSVEQCLKTGNGRMVVHIVDREDLGMSENRSCCDHAYPDLAPQLFSFNAPQGMCPSCNGIGTHLAIDPDKVVPDKTLTVREGAIVPLKNYFDSKKGPKQSWGARQLQAMEKQWKLNFDKPWNKLPKREKDILLNGSNGKEFLVRWDSAKIKADVNMAWEGVLKTMMRRYEYTQSEHQKKFYQSFMTEQPCQHCHGHRLNAEAAHVRLHGKSICDLVK